ncbi:hypothetical protein DNU06_03445 [Putridiphycobacter roseus]|uniref:VWFA domain-containing protein n=1 Tax=Putridiphycobacter roseus TaxID=2219161 RepID=A0A2W1NH91_9FLAO|nr:VWA domain-containing protein [Putridiphycobacter roseus]PZE18895.1 hypothetical protein DNU06_03445 [Putridiphycobacter roseus]
MRNLLFFITLFFYQLAYTQMQIDKTSHDFGNLYANAPTYVDFTFKNIGQAKTYLLTVDKPREVYYIYSTKTIQADSSVTVRLKINDNIKGRFNYSVDVFFSNSNKPITLNVYGNVKEKSSNPLTACPDFNAEPPVNGSPNFEVTIKVIDSLTSEPIRRSKVYLINNGEMVGTYYTNSDGIIHRPVPLGHYYITAQKDDYTSNYYQGYLNFIENYVEIKLQSPIQEIAEEIVMITEEDIEEEAPEIIIIEEETPEIITEVEEEVPEIVIEMEETTEEIVIEDTAIFEDTTTSIIKVKLDTGFNSNQFAPNNIVFIVDVSSSMNQMGKIDLLKLSMIELTKILRPQDQVSVIAYAGSVNVLFELKNGTDKEEIIEKIKTLKTGGYTAGDLAIKEGIRIAKKGYIEGGNNMIFMVTDGAFNKGSKSYQRIIQTTYLTKGIKFSVVGIKTSEYLRNHLETIAEKGGGAYIRIITSDDAQNKLFEEIKRTSFKGD